jgi:hypothetical protein
MFVTSELCAPAPICLLVVTMSVFSGYRRKRSERGKSWHTDEAKCAWRRAQAARNRLCKKCMQNFERNSQRLDWLRNPDIDATICWNAELCLNYVRFEFFTAVTMKNTVFWDLMPCGSCKNRRFGGTYGLHHQGDKNRLARNNVSSALRLLVTINVVSNSSIHVTLMRDALLSFETSILTRATGCHIPEHDTLFLCLDEVVLWIAVVLDKIHWPASVE